MLMIAERRASRHYPGMDGKLGDIAGGCTRVGAGARANGHHDFQPPERLACLVMARK